MRFDCILGFFNEAFSTAELQSIKCRMTAYVTMKGKGCLRKQPWPIDLFYGSIPTFAWMDCTKPRKEIQNSRSSGPDSNLVLWNMKQVCLSRHYAMIRTGHITNPNLLSARQEKSAGRGVGMNGDAVLFHKTCVHPCNTIRKHDALHYWNLSTRVSQMKTVKLR
jgi:hypothetical protein